MKTFNRLDIIIELSNFNNLTVLCDYLTGLNIYYLIFYSHFLHVFELNDLNFIQKSFMKVFP